MLRLEFKNYTLDFRFDAGTSRGVLKKHPVWFLKVWDSRYPSVYGLGEAAPLERLSVERYEEMEEQLLHIQEAISQTVTPLSAETALRLAKEFTKPAFPSLRFALEIALLDLMNGGKRILFDTPFTQGKASIPINGLIWMGELDTMKKQVDEKLAQGYSCIKLKIGAIDFDRELELVKYVRSRSSSVILRLDANGGFQTNEVFARLNALKPYEIHSIEQPIMPRQPEAMNLICEKSAIPIALDEELIGITYLKEKSELLDDLRPHYIILKPTLLGGFAATSEWIELANEREIGWWLTSALESNLGLNAISQFASQYPNQGYQGLGTGQLYHNNFDCPLTLTGEHLIYDTLRPWSFDLF